MERPAIYQFADELIAKIPELTKGEPTYLEVIVDARFPRERSVQAELVKRVLARVKGENAVLHERLDLNVERLTPTEDGSSRWWVLNSKDLNIGQLCLMNSAAPPSY